MVRYGVRVISPQLWRPRIPSASRSLAALIVQSRDEAGASFAAIADELNRKGLSSPRGVPFYASLVYSIYRKWRAKNEREQRRVHVDLMDVSVQASPGS
jgi:hypothetical protein